MTDKKFKGSGNAICTFILTVLLLTGLTVLILWLIYRPHKPQFTVLSATITDLNTTSPPYISTNMQFSVSTRNPNKRVGIYYDHLSAFVMYKEQQITPPVMLPPLYHAKHSEVGFSPVLGGVVPVSAEVANGLAADQEYGVVGVRFVMLGKLRWKAGVVKTRRYGVYVKCELLLGFKKGHFGQVPLLSPSNCKVEI